MSNKLINGAYYAIKCGGDTSQENYWSDAVLAQYVVDAHGDGEMYDDDGDIAKIYDPDLDMWISAVDGTHILYQHGGE